MSNPYDLSQKRPTVYASSSYIKDLEEEIGDLKKSLEKARTTRDFYKKELDKHKQVVRAIKKIVMKYNNETAKTTMPEIFKIAQIFIRQNI